ncbi:hypothetical protein [Chitinophaga sp. CB10]|uniref:hypothetical protein n=1 Tax=Chitinophaga sp. CB10 TaxID=1891659 RepID=UPI0025C33D5A|nr:hypothetical protein [Chitinophaga sp. CB10]
MKQFLIYQFAFAAILAVARPVAASARAMGNVAGMHCTALPSDTVPPAPKPTEAPQDGKLPDIIKEVPKSRRQVKPLPIPAPIPVKPIKIIKPVIIRPKVGITL